MSSLIARNRHAVKVRILSCAERELADTVDFDNAERPGLGYEFAEEVQRTLDRISAFPEAWPLFSQKARRCIVRRFPHGVLYHVRADCVLVVCLTAHDTEPMDLAGTRRHLRGAPARQRKLGIFVGLRSRA